MKNLISKLSMLLVAMSLMFVACEKPQTEEPKPEAKDPVLTLTSEATMEVAAAGGLLKITYTIDNAVEGVKLTATTDAEWITNIITSSNGKVLFTVKANDGEAREARVVVAYGDLGFEVTVKQAEMPVKEPVLTLTSEATMEFEVEGGLGQITYTLENPVEGVELTATTDAEWISGLVASGSDKVLFTVKANDGEAREAKIAVAYGDLGFEVTVKQAENPIKQPILTLISEATMEFAVEGGNGEISYTLENARENTELTATSEASWITNIVAGEKVTFTVAANEGEARETKIVVTYFTESFEVTIKQAAKEQIEDDGTRIMTYMSEATPLDSYTHYCLLSDDSGDNSVKFVIDSTAVVNGEPKIGKYPTWQSTPSYILKSTHFSFVNKSLIVNGTTYANSELTKVSLEITEAEVIVKFAINKIDYTFQYTR